MRQSANLYTRWREEIASRDWSRVHIDCERREPLEMEDRRKWTWRK